MHYKTAMKHQITNKIKLICVCLLLPLIALGQKNQNAQLAHEFLKNGHYTKASELYSDLYNTHKSTNYYQGLIECYFSLNQIDEAEKLVKKHTKKDNNASILVDYAHVYILKEEEKKAKKKFNELFKLLESNPQYTISAANKLTKYNYLEEAVKAYEIALKDPSKSSYRFKLARIYGQLNNLEMMYENYLEVVMSNKAYLKNVKTMLSRTVSKDSENENNVLLKSILLNKVQQSNNQNIAELLIWLFVQEKNFDAALDQEKAMDQKWNLNQKKVFKLADICRKNKAFEVALQCYKYIIEVGTDSKYFLDAQLSLLTVNKELLESDPKSSKEKWEQLEIDYTGSLNNIGRTSYTILLLRDLAVIQAFR